MAEYQYLLASSMNGDIIDEISMSNVSYETGLNGAGSFEGSISLEDPKATPSMLQTLSREIVAVRDGAVVFSGPIVGLEPSMASNVVTIRCGSAWWWMGRSTVELTLDYTDEDVGEIFWDHIDIAQQKVPGGDKRITRSASYSTTGQLLTRKFPGANRKYVSDVANELVRLYPGFDFMVNLSWDSTNRVRRDVQVYAPFKGTTVTTALNVENGLTDVGYSEDGAVAMSRVHEIGATTNNTVLLKSRNDTNTIGVSIPMVESVVSRTDVTSGAILDLWAQGDLALMKWPVRVYGASMRFSPNLPHGSISPGDTVLLDAAVGQFPINAEKRVVALRISVSPSNDEAVGLTFNDPISDAGS